MGGILHPHLQDVLDLLHDYKQMKTSILGEEMDFAILSNGSRADEVEDGEVTIEKTGDKRWKQLMYVHEQMKYSSRVLYPSTLNSIMQGALVERLA